MSWWTALTGLFRPARELIEVFTPNAEQDALRDHTERMALSTRDLASLEQFAAEFHTRTRRTWWDSWIDGLNRLPRPVITLAILGFFVLAPLDPVQFLAIAHAYQMMPDGFWALLSVIVAFYFGGRMQLKRQDMAVRGGALTTAREILAIQHEARSLAAIAEPASAPAPAVEPVTAADRPTVEPGNRVIAEWRRRRAAAAA